MAREQINISLSPEIAKFVRRKVKAGSYTNAGEVVRTALRRMKDDEVREAEAARTAVDEILAEVAGEELGLITERVRSGFAAIERGEYTDYTGRAGLDEVAERIKTRGRKGTVKA